MTEENDKELVPVFGGSVDIAASEQLIKAMEDTAGDGGRMGDVSFMSFSGKMGTFKIGVDARGLEDDEPFLVAIPSFELGWMCWKGGKPVSKRFANVSQPKVAEPNPEEFGPFDSNKGEGWSKARAITMKSMLNDEQVYFSNNSKSGVAEMSDLQRDVLSRLKEGQPAWPVITLKSEPFESGGFKNFKPSITIIKWLSTEDVQKLADPDLDPMSLLDDVEEKKTEKAPEPAKRSRRL